MNRDIFHSFHDFGESGTNSHQSYWLRKLILKLILWVVFMLFACWFAYESYLGLLIYDG